MQVSNADQPQRLDDVLAQPGNQFAQTMGNARGAGSAGQTPGGVQAGSAAQGAPTATAPAGSGDSAMMMMQMLGQIISMLQSMMQQFQQMQQSSAEGAMPEGGSQMAEQGLAGVEGADGHCASGGEDGGYGGMQGGTGSGDDIYSNAGGKNENVLATGTYADAWGLESVGSTGVAGWEGAYGLSGANPWDGTPEDMEGYAQQLLAEQEAFKGALGEMGISIEGGAGEKDKQLKSLVDAVGSTISANGIDNVEALTATLIEQGADPAALTPEFVSSFARLARAMTDNHNHNMNHEAVEAGLIPHSVHHFAHLFNKTKEGRAGGNEEIYWAAAGDGIGGGGSKPQFVAQALDTGDAGGGHGGHGGHGADGGHGHGGHAH
jgi:hypothetical protein